MSYRKKVDSQQAHIYSLRLVIGLQIVLGLKGRLMGSRYYPLLIG